MKRFQDIIFGSQSLKIHSFVHNETISYLFNHRFAFGSSLFATSNFLYVFNSSAGPLANRKYKVIGFLMNEIEFRPFEKIGENNIISVRFDTSSSIELVPMSFIE